MFFAYFMIEEQTQSSEGWLGPSPCWLAQFFRKKNAAKKSIYSRGFRTHNQKHIFNITIIGYKYLFISIAHYFNPVNNTDISQNRVVETVHRPR